MVPKKFWHKTRIFPARTEVAEQMTAFCTGNQICCTKVKSWRNGKCLEGKSGERISMIERIVRRHQLHGEKRDVAFFEQRKRDEERTRGETAVAEEEPWSGWNQVRKQVHKIYHED